MNQQEQDFLQKLQAAFEIEAEEHLQAMSSGLLELEKASAAAEQTPIIETVYREAHSLKGAARAVNRTDIEGICQPLESVFAAWKRHERNPSPEDFDTLHRAIDSIGKLLSSSESERTGVDTNQVSELVQQLGVIEKPNQRNRTQPQRDGSRPQCVEAVKPEEEKVEKIKQENPVSSVVKVAEPPLAAPSPAPEKSSLAETVRISTAKLDKLLLEAEEMLAVKMTARQRAADLRDVKFVFESWKKEWAKVQPRLRDLRDGESKTADGQESNGNSHQHAARDAQSALLEFVDWNQAFLKSLEGQLAPLAKLVEQDQHSLGKLVDDLLEDSKKLLMLPFSTLLSVLPKLARDLCRDQGKEAEVVIRGGHVEIDKRILEEMKDPLIHVLRNCIDHGIEKPEQRARQNKPPRATVTIAVSQVNGSKVEILLSDDGAGIDLEKVKSAAVKHGIVSEAEARKLNDQEALALIFQSEVSTSPIITEISGRGLGLAIVWEKVEKLSGRVSVETHLHGGTTFRILLPLTLATFRGILVKAADQIFVIPAASVERADRIKRDEIKTVGNREAISLDGHAVSLARLDAVLELPGKETNGEIPNFLPLVVLGSGDKRIAFGVDEVLNEEEVLVKPLGKPLSRVRNIAGATVLGSGKAVPVLHVADLLKSAMKASAPAALAAEPSVNGEAKRKSILVAEDSITSRMLLKNILESAGYQVKTTVDGVDALTTLKTEDFDLVVSDVEMPRMNGFDLTAKIRGDKKLAETPVVLVTALASQQDRERGVDAGADAYIVKRDFDQSNLLETVQRLI